MSDPGKAVFLSYASQDAEAARKICAALRAAGVEVWFDQSELVGGDAWDAKIRKQIGSCALFVPIISGSTEARREGYFRLEWRLAVERMRQMDDDLPFLLPVVVDDTKEAGAHVPDRFRETQWTRLPGGVTTPTFVARVKKLLSGEHHAANPEAATRQPSIRNRRTSRLWWALPIFGASMALLLVLREQRKSPAAQPPTDKSPAASMTKAQQLVVQARALYEREGLANANDFDLAKRLLKEATELEPLNVDAWLSSAIMAQLFDSLGFDRSDEIHHLMDLAIDRVTILAPGSDQARTALALRYERDRNFREVVQIWTELAERHGDDKYVLRHLGQYLDRVGRTEDGLKTLTRATRLPGDDPLAHNFMARILDDHQRFDEGLAEWDKAIAIAPDFGMAYIRRIERSLFKLGDLARTRWEVDNVPARLLRDERVATAVAYYSYFLRDTSKVQEALRHVSRDYVEFNLLLMPKSMLAGFAHRLEGRREAAAVEWRVALRVVDQRLVANPAGLSDRYLKAMLHAALGERDVAEQELRKYEELNKGPAGIAEDRWEIYAELGREAELIDFFGAQIRAGSRKMAAIVRFEPDLDPFRSHLQFQALVRQAEGVFEKATSPDPQNTAPPAPSALNVSSSLSPARALVAKAVPLFEDLDSATRGDFELAGEMLKQAIDQAPLDAEVWAYYSYFCSNIYSIGFDSTKERDAEIKRAADKAMKLDPKSDMARLAWANYYRRQRPVPDEVIRVLRELTQGNSENKKLMLRVLAGALKANEDLEESMKVLDQAIALPGGDAHAWLQKSIIYSQTSRLVDAEAAIDRSLATKITPRVLIQKATYLIQKHDDFAAAEKLLARVPGEFRQEDRHVSAVMTLAFCQRNPERCLGALAGFPRDFIQDDLYISGFTGPKSLYAGYAHWMQGKPDVARLEWEEALKLVDQRLQARRTDVSLNRQRTELLALLGRRSDAESVLRLLEQIDSSSGFNTRLRATINVWNGGVDEQLEKLRAGEQAPVSMRSLRYDPQWEPLRKDPRFQAWLDQASSSAKATTDKEAKK